MKWLAKKWLELRGWTFAGGPPNDPRYIIVGAPHTSNWDFVIFLGAIQHFDIRPRYLGKHTLFRGPFGWLFRRWGGIPVDRTRSSGIIEQVEKEFASNEEFALVIAPEGTRKAAPYWKSGFVKIAEATGAPIVPARIEYEKRVLTLGEPIHHNGSVEDLMDELRLFFRDASGKIRSGEGPIRLREELSRES